MYLSVPVILYGSERLIRALRSSVRPVRILKVAVYSGNVLALHVSKPHGFKYRSGQYIFVNCAAVSPFEWLVPTIVYLYIELILSLCSHILIYIYI